MLHGVYCLQFRPAQMFSLHSWAFSTTTLVFVFLGSHNCIKVTLTICIRRSRRHPLLFLTTSPNTKSAVEPQPRKWSSRESRIKHLDCPTDFIKNKYWETKAFLPKNKSHFLCSETNKLLRILHHMFQTASHMLSHFQPLRREIYTMTRCSQNRRSFYVLDSVVPFEEDATHEFKGHRDIAVEELPSWCYLPGTDRRSRKAVSR